MPKKANQIVKKSNAFIRGHWEIKSIWEPRLVALVASKIRMDDEDFKMYRLPIVEILGDIRAERSGKNYDDLESAIKNLMGRPLTIQETPSRLAIYNVFGKCIIDRKRGFVEVRFDPDLKPHFLDLQNRFTQYDLSEFMSLSSIYSQRMYEILKSWSDKPEVDIALDDLHDMLDTPVSSRKNFAEFRRKVLDQAHKDIVEREGCSLWYDWEPIKSGRAGKVVAVHFVFNWAKAKELKKNQPTDEVFIHHTLQRDSNRCFERITKARKKCTPKPKTPKCKFCLERGRMMAQKIIEENQGKLPLGN